MKATIFVFMITKVPIMIIKNKTASTRKCSFDLAKIVTRAETAGLVRRGATARRVALAAEAGERQQG